MSQAVTPIVCLMCGSFNPVTRMHLKLLEIVKKFVDENNYRGLSIIKGIVSPVNDLYHVKRRNLIPVNHRIAMVNLALEEDNLKDWVECSSWEADQKEWQTTLKVLGHHHNQMKQRFGPFTQTWMVSGGDLIESMAVPGLWADDDLEKIATNFKLFIVPRIGSDAVRFISSHPILSRHSDNIIIPDNVIPTDDSSTLVRASIMKGIYPANLVHQTVLDYIKQHGFYKDT